MSRELNAMGIKLGLWLEPEMISEDSKVAKLHPDWICKIFERKPNEVKPTYVLDLSQQEIRDYLFDSLSELFSSSNIAYIKWDMNRYI